MPRDAPPQQGGRSSPQHVQGISPGGQQGAPQGTPVAAGGEGASGTRTAQPGQRGQQLQGTHPPQRQGQPRGRGVRGRPGRPLLEPVTLEEIVADDVVTAERDTPIRTVVAQMAENDVGSVVVIDDGEPIGIVTDRKVALALEGSLDVAGVTAEDLIGGDLVTADMSMTVFDVLQRMSERGIRRLPVTDDGNNLQGIVSLDDVVVLLGTELGNVAETIRAQIDRL